MGSLTSLILYHTTSFLCCKKLHATNRRKCRRKNEKKHTLPLPCFLPVTLGQSHYSTFVHELSTIVHCILPAVICTLPSYIHTLTSSRACHCTERVTAPPRTSLLPSTHLTHPFHHLPPPVPPPPRRNLLYLTHAHTALKGGEESPAATPLRDMPAPPPILPSLCSVPSCLSPGCPCHAYFFAAADAALYAAIYIYVVYLGYLSCHSLFCILLRLSSCLSISPSINFTPAMPPSHWQPHL